MPSSSKPKPTTPRAAFHAKVFDWSKRLWSAVSKASQYSEVHESFLKEFKKIRDEGQALNVTAVTMVNHVTPIYNHIALQGYKADIHYLPLKEAVANYCEGKPVADWKAPSVELNRSSSSSPSPSPSPVKEPPRKGNAEPTRKKGKAKAAVLDDRSDRDESEKELAKSRKPTADKGEANLPTTEGMEINPTKCALCEHRGHVCHVNPKATKAAACFECNHWRLKCSLAPTRTKKAEEEEVAASKEPAIVVKRRKKPTQVPAGHPGQIGCEFLTFFLPTHLLISFALADSLAPDILKKLESYESGNSQLLEKIEEQSQAIVRLTAENRSTREWFKTRLELLWESSSNRDEAIAESMKAILTHAEEMSLHVGLRQAGEKLEALLKDSSRPAVPTSTPPAVPGTLAEGHAATPKTTTPKTTPTRAADSSSKRPADETSDSGSKPKRRKVGEP